MKLACQLTKISYKKAMATKLSIFATWTRAKPLKRDSRAFNSRLDFTFVTPLLKPISSLEEQWAGTKQVLEIGQPCLRALIE